MKEFAGFKEVRNAITFLSLLNKYPDVFENYCRVNEESIEVALRQAGLKK